MPCKTDPRLRSTNAVTSYHIQALDGEVGHVEDFIIDDETQTVEFEYRNHAYNCALFSRSRTAGA